MICFTHKKNKPTIIKNAVIIENNTTNQINVHTVLLLLLLLLLMMMMSLIQMHILSLYDDGVDNVDNSVFYLLRFYLRCLPCLLKAIAAVSTFVFK